MTSDSASSTSPAATSAAGISWRSFQKNATSRRLRARFTARSWSSADESWSNSSNVGTTRSLSQVQHAGTSAHREEQKERGPPPGARGVVLPPPAGRWPMVSRRSTEDADAAGPDQQAN